MGGTAVAVGKIGYELGEVKGEEKGFHDGYKRASERYEKSLKDQALAFANRKDALKEEYDYFIRELDACIYEMSEEGFESPDEQRSFDNAKELRDQLVRMRDGLTM